MAALYDGMKMRKRYPGEKKSYNSGLVVAMILYGPFHLLFLALGRRCRHVFLWAVSIARNFG